jgi:hypothetical protein
MVLRRYWRVAPKRFCDMFVSSDDNIEGRSVCAKFVAVTLNKN